MNPSGSAVSGRDRLLQRVVAHFAAHGIADTSLRSLAEHIGSSHRMLLYYFGSREGLLSAVVDHVEAAGRASLRDAVSDGAVTDDPLAAGLRFWTAISSRALTYGPLFFELSSHAMQDRPPATASRGRLVAPWLDALAATWIALGVPRAEARVYARLDLAVARGLLHDLLLTGQQRQVNAAMRQYAITMIAARSRSDP